VGIIRSWQRSGWGDIVVASALLLTAACSTGAGDDGSVWTGSGAAEPPDGNTSTPVTTGASGADDAMGTADGDGGSSDATTSPADSAEDTAGDPKVPPGECGNGVAEDGEECDANDLADASCDDFGFAAGVLACGAACTLITDACFTCGDGMIGLPETCDGTALGGATCQSLGFGGGVLGCAADCQELDTSGCTALPSCGDGIVNGGEQCDGAALGGNTCVSQGFDMGVLACTASCVLDVSGCADDLTGCGEQGDFCLFNEMDLQSTCCPAGVGGNVLGICDIFLCV
jgi:hypothetical protein